MLKERMFLETGTLTQWTKGRYTLGCIVDDDESSFCRIWVPLPFPIRDDLPKTRSSEIELAAARERSYKVILLRNEKLLTTIILTG